MKRLKLLIFSSILAITASAQPPAGLTAKDLLKKMPQEVVPLLTRNNILDCIDFIEHDSPTEVTNRMGGKSEMTELTPSLASFFITASSSLDIKVLPRGDNDVLIYVINTHTADSLDDCSIRVYDSQWQLVPEDLQFHFRNPATYNSVKVQDGDNLMHVREVFRPLLFNGETRNDHPDQVEEYTLRWENGTFNF